MKRLLTLSVLALSVSAPLAGCNRVHIRDDFGQYTRLFFARQVVHAEAAEGSATGLDSEEAALIHANYRGKLQGDRQSGRQGREQQVLILDPSASGTKPSAKE